MPRLVADRRPRPFRAVLTIAALVLIAAAISWVFPVITYDCARDAGSGTVCTIRERILGVYSFREQSLAGVTSVDVDRDSVEWTSNKQKRSATTYRIILSDARGDSIAPARPVAGRGLGDPSDDIESALRIFLSESAPGRLHKWHTNFVPSLIEGALLLLALLIAALPFLVRRRS